MFSMSILWSFAADVGAVEDERVLSLKERFVVLVDALDVLYAAVVVFYGGLDADGCEGDVSGSGAC